MNRSLRRRLARRLAEAVEAGDPIDVIAERLRGEFNFARSRAQTIARTEIGAAVEEARAEGRRQAGIPLKSWLHSRKETGRPTHRATEDETTERPIPAEDDFTIAGTAVTAPHPRATGDPAHDINCGCTTLSRFPGEGARAMAKRYLRRGFLTYEQMIQREAPTDAA